MKKILIALLFLKSINVGATTYYIDPSGVDDAGRDGSISQPWQLLSYACSRVAAGDHTIFVNAGTYPVDAAQASLRVGVKIDGTGATSYLKTTYTSTSSYLGWIYLYSASLTDGNQSIKNIKIGGESLASSCAITIVNRNNIEISNVEIFDFSARGINIRHDGGGITFITGIIIHDCNIYNCSDRLAATSCGLIVDKGTDGTDIHDNILTQNSRAETHNGNIYTSWHETTFNKNTKFYRNTCTKPDTDGALSGAGGWNFHIESGGTLGGCQVYNNTFIGGVAVDLAAGPHTKGDSDYSWWVHHNYHYQTAQVAYAAGVPRTVFVDLERTCEDVIVEYNLVEKAGEPIASNLSDPGTHITGLKVRYNIFTQLGYVPSTTSPARYGINLGTNNATAYIEDIEIDNNVIDGNGIIGAVGVHATAGGYVRNVKIRNNIITDIVSWGWLAVADEDGTYDDFYAQNNIIFNCVNDTAVYYDGAATITNYVRQNNIIDDPLFISPSNFRLQVSSPAINAGTDVSLTSDYDGNPIVGIPDIGAFEYQTLPIPVTGLGWEPVLSHRNFKGDVNLAGRWMIDAIPVTATAAELNALVGQGQIISGLDTLSLSNRINSKADTSLSNLGSAG